MTQHPDPTTPMNSASLHTGPLSFHKPPTFDHEQLAADLAENMGLAQAAIDSDPKTPEDSAAARDMYVLENLALLDSQAVESTIQFYKNRCNQTISAFDALMILLTMQLKLEEDRKVEPLHPIALKRLPPPLLLEGGAAIANTGPTTAELADLDAPITLSETAEAFQLQKGDQYIIKVSTMMALLETQRTNFTAAGVDSSKSRSHTDRLIIMANGLNPDNVRAMESLEMPARYGMSMASVSRFAKLHRQSPPLPPISVSPLGPKGRGYKEQSSVDRFEKNALLARQARGNAKPKDVASKLKEYRKKQARKKR